MIAGLDIRCAMGLLLLTIGRCLAAGCSIVNSISLCLGQGYYRRLFAGALLQRQAGGRHGRRFLFLGCSWVVAFLGISWPVRNHQRTHSIEAV